MTLHPVPELPALNAVVQPQQAYWPRARVVTNIPGRASQAYLDAQEENESSAVSYPKRLPLAIKRGFGSYVEDMDGNLFIDCLSGAGVLPLGHSHPELVRVASEQLHQFSHGLDFPTPVKEQFREAHLSKVPKAMGKTRMHFCGPTGADAVEASIKLARLVTGRHNIIAFHGSYHGCSLGALGLTGDLQVKSRLAPLSSGIHFFPFQQAENTGQNKLNTGYDFECAAYLEETLNDPNSGMPKPAAIILELIQGEGGVYPADKNFIKDIRCICDAHGILLIIDEIQTGCGRTGKWFGFEHYEISPDIVCLSKALSGLGMPASALIYKEEFNLWHPGDHIGTFRGNQIAFASGARFVQLMDEEKILENVDKSHTRLMAELLYIGSDFDCIANVRGKGLMLGMEIVNPDTGKRNGDLAKRIQRLALSNGLILEVGGRNGAVIRLLPPLNISNETISQTAEILRTAIGVAAKEAGQKS